MLGIIHLALAVVGVMITEVGVFIFLISGIVEALWR